MSVNESHVRSTGVAGAAEGQLAAEEQPQKFSPKPSGRKQKLTTEPHGYIADKLATFLRAIKQLGRGSRKSRSSDTKAATSTDEPAANIREQTVDSAASLTAPGPPAQQPAKQSGLTPSQGVHESGIVQQLHHHEAADQLHNPLSTTAKLRNAVVSTVEHALDEAAAVQASLGSATAEELSKFRHDAHRGPVITTAGGLPLEGAQPRD